MPPSYSPCPRPCLKKRAPVDPPAPRDEPHQLLAIDPGILHPLVHFAPPATTHVVPAYAPSEYDRSPIVVAPNQCALPARGCPGRTYTLDAGAGPSARRARSPAPGRHRHPRADDVPLALPALVPDLSSESDESDGAPAAEADRALLFAQYQMAQRTAGDAASALGTDKPRPLSFLPHPHAPPRAPSNPQSPPASPGSPADDAARRRAVRRRPGSRAASRSPEGARARYKAFAERSALGAGGDLGCLGGF